MHHNTDLLPFYAAGTLAPDAAAALEAHLAVCPACRAALAEWQQIAGAVRADAANRVPALPPLDTAQIVPPAYRPVPARNGHHRFTHDKETPMIAAVPFPRKRNKRTPALTLIAALLVVVLFGGALALFGAQLGASPDGGGSNGASGLVQASATPTILLPSLVPTATPLRIYPVTSTPPASDGPYAIMTVPPQANVTYAALDAQGAGELPTYPPGTIMVVPDTGIMVLTATLVHPMAVSPQPALLPTSARLEGIFYQAQGWNNQGPAALAMALSYFDVVRDQQEIAAWVKPDPEDKWVNPWELVAYANEQASLNAIYRVGGTADALKQLVAAGYPVIVATGIEPADEDWMGHYVVVSGYDDTTSTFTVQDSYLGANRAVKYGEFDAGWRQFNRAFIVIYRPLEQDTLKMALGVHADPVRAINMGLDSARRDAAADPEDAWAWVNLGSGYTLLGAYGSATGAFDKALALGVPWRLAWYHPELYEAYYGAYDYDDVIALADETLAETPYVEDAAYWKGMALAAQGSDAAADAFAQVFASNPHYLRMLRWKFEIEGFGPLVFISPVEHNVCVEAVPGVVTPTPILWTPSPFPTVTPSATPSPTHTPTPAP